MKTYTKFDVDESEYLMYKRIQNLNIVNIPKLIWYDNTLKIMTTELIESLNIADQYTDDAEAVPDNIYQSIVNTIKILFKNGIVFPDITGYNFIYHHDKLWIIDFEHAVDIINAAPIHKDFVQEFCTYNSSSVMTTGVKQWNPYFE
jgi:serine/threonine-protein kinase RIO1